MELQDNIVREEVHVQDMQLAWTQNSEAISREQSAGSLLLSFPSDIRHWCHHCSIGLLALDGTVNVSHKYQWCTETNSSQHEEETIADAGHVAEEEGCLHEAWHVWPGMVVVDAVEEDENTSGSSTKDRSANRSENF
jgi:hypothetical protein